MAFSVGGLVSGMDTESIISQLTDVERQPIVKLQQKEAAYQVKLTAYGSLRSVLSGLKTASSALDNRTDLNQFTGVSSNSGTFTASVFSTAKSGTYSIEVESLAQVQKLKSAAFNMDEAIGAGKFTLQLGTGTAVEITTDGTEKLSTIADRINESQKDIQASVITNGDQSYLLLTGQRTGEANTIRLEVTEETPPTPPADPPDPGDVTDNMGLSRLRYIQGGENNRLTQTQGASDAVLTVDGVAGIHRSTNMVADVIKGVTLTLKGTTALNKPETLTVSRDTTALASKVNAFVEAYNSVSDFFIDAQSYDPKTQEAGELLGDSTARQIRKRLDSLIGGAVAGASSGLSRLSDLGVAMDKEGKLTVDSNTLNDALTNRFDDVSTFFATDTGESKGFGVRLVNTLDTMLNKTRGDLAQKTNSFQSSVDRIQKDIARYEKRTSNITTRLQTQFQHLEKLLGQYQKTSDFMTQQIEALQNMNKR
ncbi:flagellar filament capping protein FliD [Desulforhabdus sp. TSK]|uniref:flagellar filament capping protein FliD n=1 Tax=Desulforhabdus sp. TSK TaxID=2925014 RepID=UPI001FC7CCA8|nr:flagellar filament capping protein FliD [Desulforhabdus sp. TSK]GKT07330.1 flagellar hook-associated protein 2 [Desulforhabdus sp. TSK]